MRGIRTRTAVARATAALLAVVVVAGLATTSVSAGAATPLRYVALGDSYTSAPNVGSLAPGASILCLQSTGNYPHLLAASLGASLTDVSCAAANVGNMTTSQYPGVAPQFNALSSSTQVVTLGIGGNDNNTFISAIVGCFATDALDVFNIGAPCKAAFGSSFVNNINADAVNIAAALQGIHARSPQAKVFLVGYPDILPQSGNCYPTIPVTSGDVTYLNGMEQALNSMLETQAHANGAVFVDTFTPTIGHDACKSASVRDVEPVISGSTGIFLHPNAAGEQAMATAVRAAMTAAGI